MRICRAWARSRSEDPAGARGSATGSAGLPISALIAQRQLTPQKHVRRAHDRAARHGRCRIGTHRDSAADDVACEQADRDLLDEELGLGAGERAMIESWRGRLLVLEDDRRARAGQAATRRGAEDVFQSPWSSRTTKIVAAEIMPRSADHATPLEPISKRARSRSTMAKQYGGASRRRCRSGDLRRHTMA